MLDMLSCRTLNAVLLGQLVQEDDVEHDPADRQQAECRPVACCQPGDLRRHAEHEDRDQQRCYQPDACRVVRPHVPEAQQDHHDDDRDGRDQARQDDVVEGVVVLLPDHGGLLWVLSSIERRLLEWPCRVSATVSGQPLMTGQFGLTSLAKSLQ
jgi:hypothetical protein